MRMDVLVAQSAVSSQNFHGGYKKTTKTSDRATGGPHHHFNPRSELINLSGTSLTS